MADHLDPDLPPAPAVRTITPAPEDYAQRPSAAAYLWPLGWMAVAVALWKIVEALGWTPFPG